MAITWGSTTIKVQVGTWKPGILPAVFQEIQLIPDATNLTVVASVLQQGGRPRRRATGRVYVSSMTAYEALVTSYLTGTAQTLADGDSVNASYMIESIGEPEYKQNNAIFFDIAFVEV